MLYLREGWRSTESLNCPNCGRAPEQAPQTRGYSLLDVSRSIFLLILGGFFIVMTERGGKKEKNSKKKKDGKDSQKGDNRGGESRIHI